MAVAAVSVGAAHQADGDSDMNFDLKRIWSHLCTGNFTTRKHFPTDVLTEITSTITSSEAKHTGQIQFAVEPSLGLPELLKGVTARQRAIDVFSQLRVWDTEENCGVLIYLLEAEHQIEIVADRGITKLSTPEFWETVCVQMERHLKTGHFKEGVIEGIQLITEEIARNFPPKGASKNELDNAPIIL